MEYGEEQVGGTQGPRLPGDNGSEARSRTQQAQEWARSRGAEATDWARSRMYEIQGRVESDPQRAILWALGAGLVAGVLLASLALRGGRIART